MKDPVVKLPCTIDVLSPLHIGVGEQLSWMALVAEDHNLYVVDEKRLLARVGRNPKDISHFMDYVEEPNGRIDRYLKDRRIPIREVAAYSVPVVGRLPGRGGISSCIKQPGPLPRPYIPGSSLKGAVRTALLQAALLQDKSFLNEASQAVRQQLAKGQAKYADDQLERMFFGRDQHHDWMRALRFADTDAVGTDRLAVVEVQTLSVHGAMLQPKRFTIHPEALMPNRYQLRGSVMINTCLVTPGPAESALDVGQANQWATQFVKKCNEAAAWLIQREITFYGECNAGDLRAWYKDLNAHLKTLSGGACLLWLGWGSGYDSQAVGNFFDKPLQETLRLEYDLGKIVHKGCGGRVGRASKPRGKNRWSCKKCRANLIHDDDVQLVWPFAKSRKVAVTLEGKRPLGWIKLRI
jgi:CRISPR-associated protein Csm5